MIHRVATRLARDVWHRVGGVARVRRVPCGVALCARAGAATWYVYLLTQGDDAWGGTSLSLGDWCVDVHASVLGLRGTSVQPQPLASRDELLWFTWNGEIFEADDAVLCDMSQNDALQLFHRWTTVPFHEALLVHTLAYLDGPYAFVLLDVRALTHTAT